MFVLSFVSFIWNIFGQQEGEQQADQIFLFIATALPTTCLLLTYMIAEKNLAFVDLHGPAFLGSFSLVIIVVSIPGVLELGESGRGQQQSLCFIYYALYVGILTTDFFPHFITRTVLYLGCRGLLLYSRVVNNETSHSLLLVLYAAAWLLVELLFFAQLKAQAKL
jgi:hypothetical protein